MIPSLETFIAVRFDFEHPSSSSYAACFPPLQFVIVIIVLLLFLLFSFSFPVFSLLCLFFLVLVF